MLDLVLINPVAYRGAERRGPYELETLMTLAKRSQAQCRLLDLQQTSHSGEINFPFDFNSQIREIILQNQARVYFVTLRSTGGPWAELIAKTIKHLFPESYVVFYAPRVERRIARYMKRSRLVDVLCLTRAEESIEAIVRALAFGEIALSQVPGIMYRSGESLVSTPNESVKTRLEELPVIKPWISLDRTVAAVQVGRGCAFGCNFCSVNINVAPSPVYTSAERIVRHAEEAYKSLDPHIAKFVMLEAENLLSNRDLVREVIQLRRASNATFLWGAYGRIDCIDDSYASLLSEGGCRFIFLGIETGSPRLQRFLGKNLELAHIVPKIKLLSSLKVLTLSSFIYGIPDETYSELLMSAALMAQIVWSGGKVDWTALRIESHTSIDEFSESRELLFMPNSELCRDLVDAGINPEEVDKDLGYRMYAIKNTEFDLNQMWDDTAFFRDGLHFCPVTIYALHKGVGFDFSVFFSHISSACPDSNNPSTAWIKSVIQSTSGSQRAFLTELFEFECAFSNVRADLVASDTQTINWHLIYGSILKDPAKLPAIIELDWWSEIKKGAEPLVVQSGDKL